MTLSPLNGQSLLVVEDEALIALDIASTLEDAGAAVTVASSFVPAMRLAEIGDFSAAILDHGLPDGDSARIYECLASRGIPFVIHSGHTELQIPYPNAVIVTKPAPAEMLAQAVAKLLKTATVGSVRRADDTATFAG